MEERGARSMLTTLLDLLAVVLIVAGVALIYVPAAIVVAGGGVLAISYGISSRRVGES